MNCEIQRETVKDVVMKTRRQSWEEIGEKMEKDSEENQKSQRREKSGNTKQIKKETCLEKRRKTWIDVRNTLTNVRCERQTGDDEEEDIEEQKEEMKDGGIRTEEVIDAIRVLKSEKAAGHDKITEEVLQNMGEN